VGQPLDRKNLKSLYQEFDGEVMNSALVK